MSIQIMYSLTGIIYPGLQAHRGQECHRDLGLLVQHSLNWTNHHNNISAKAYAILSQLKRNFSLANSQFTKKCLYKSLVRSQLTYCSQLWRPMLVGDFIALERIQRRATKFVVGSSWSVSITRI